MLYSSMANPMVISSLLEVSVREIPFPLIFHNLC
jgi:hypothetical protein